MSVRLADCQAVLDAAYDPAWAAEWDAIGLVCGDPDTTVERVHLAVDPTPAVASEALALGAGLLVTHHPLFLRGVHGVAADTQGGRVVHELVRGGAGLLVAHTNADVASPGVSDALGAALELTGLTVLAPDPARLELLVTYVPTESAAALLDALAAAGAGQLGHYDRCAFTAPGTGTFRPLAGAQPSIGRVGVVEEVAETRIELVLAPGSRDRVVAALRAAHPYEEPAFSVLPAVTPARRGLGRVGELSVPTTLGEFASLVAARLPRTAAGVRASGDLDRSVHRVAVCGGAGLETAGAAARAGADVLVTADARHHTTLEAGLPIIDVAHWASEWPWLTQAAGVLAERLPTVAVSVSSVVTDPWTIHAGG